MTVADRSVRLAGMRGMIAAKMVKSLQTAAQLTFHAECEADALLAARERLKRAGRSAGVEDLMILALARALAAHPGLNGHVLEDRIELRASMNVAVAVALPNGLVAPCLFDVQGMDLDDVAAGRADLVARARSGKLKVEEMSGGTVTLSNLGRSRVRFFTPILNTPQIAIVGVGTTQETVVPLDDGFGRRTSMGLSLTVDHRAVDGAPAADFLTTLCGEIEGIGAHVP